MAKRLDLDDRKEGGPAAFADFSPKFLLEIGWQEKRGELAQNFIQTPKVFLISWPRETKIDLL